MIDKQPAIQIAVPTVKSRYLTSVSTCEGNSPVHGEFNSLEQKEGSRDVLSLVKERVDWTHPQCRLGASM